MFRFSCLVVASLLVLATIGSAQKLNKQQLEAYGKLYNGYQAVFKEFVAAYTDYETIKEDNPTKIDPSIVRALLVKFKALKNGFQRSRSAFDDFIVTYVTKVDVIFRAGFEGARFKHTMYVKVIDQIMYEILGKLSGISDFKKEEVSGQLQSVYDLVNIKFDNLKDIMLDIEKRLDAIQTNDGLKNLLNELQVLNDLNKMIDELKQTRQSVGMTFLEEINRIENEGKEMNMLQKAEMDVFLSLCIWFEGYASHFQELLLKMVGNSAPELFY